MALSACGDNGNNNAANSPAATASASAPAAGGQTQEITLEATNFQFSPADIQAHVGDTLKITLKNASGNHGVEIPDLGVSLKNGESAEVKLDKAGTFDFNCSIQCGSGHDNMVGTITVS
nr:cupredoxin domain-containing protein [Cohnella lubricantis]